MRRLTRTPLGRHVRDHDGPAAVAQLVEQRTFNPTVVGSSPTGGIEKELVVKGFVYWPDTPTALIRRMSSAQDLSGSFART